MDDPSTDLLDIEPLPPDLQSLSGAMDQESDRGCALVAAAVLDDRLRLALVARLRQDRPKVVDQVFGPSRPMATFSSRINLAFLLGVLSEAMLEDLTQIREIRNRFAHSPVATTFATQAVADRCRNLRTPFWKDLEPRALFEQAVFGILGFLDDMIGKAKRPEPPDAADPDELATVTHSLLELGLIQFGADNDQSGEAAKPPDAGA